MIIIGVSIAVAILFTLGFVAGLAWHSAFHDVSNEEAEKPKDSGRAHIRNWKHNPPE